MSHQNQALDLDSSTLPSTGATENVRESFCAADEEPLVRPGQTRDGRCGAKARHWRLVPLGHAGGEVGGRDAGAHAHKAAFGHGQWYPSAIEMADAELLCNIKCYFGPHFASKLPWVLQRLGWLRRTF